MGNTYGFCKVRKDKFMSEKSRFIMDSDLFVEDNPDYIDIVGDLDREDFLYSLVKPKPGRLETLDPGLAEFVKNSYDPMEEQAIVVTRDSVQHAIDVLVDLDGRVAVMPCDKSCEAHVIYKRFLEPGEWNYVEDRPREKHETDDDGYAYVSSCKDNVDIYKEVEKVYGHRAYHYGFPWKECPKPGASDIIECLNRVVYEMSRPDSEEYVFLFTWD